jgi:hypothetical protein
LRRFFSEGPARLSPSFVDFDIVPTLMSRAGSVAAARCAGDEDYCSSRAFDFGSIANLCRRGAEPGIGSRGASDATRVPHQSAPGSSRRQSGVRPVLAGSARRDRRR